VQGRRIEPSSCQQSVSELFCSHQSDHIRLRSGTGLPFSVKLFVGHVGAKKYDVTHKNRNIGIEMWFGRTKEEEEELSPVAVADASKKLCGSPKAKLLNIRGSA
jgi:hypothetical protein